MPKETNSNGENQSSSESESEEYDVIIVGAGAAGVGVAIALVHAGVENFLIVDRDTVGSSFAAWPDETKFITPSFPSNSIGMLDLNSIAIGISPAFTMRVEHPTGKQFAAHLQDIANYFELPVEEDTDVKSIEKIDDMFHLGTDEGVLVSKNVIWAAGEYQYPNLAGFEGSDLCRHTSTVPSYGGLEGDDFLIIGGYESGVDAAFHLSSNGKEVRLFDMNAPWEETTSDPSVALSTFSFERMRKPSFGQHTELYANTPVSSVTLDNGVYVLKTEDGQIFESRNQPLLAGGFSGSHKFVSHLFEERDDGFPVISDSDESTITPGLYLSGPSVRHDGHVFCFIYKYRQRFAIVAQAIASSMDIETDDFVDAYKSWGMYLDDLSCCGQECLTC